MRPISGGDRVTVKATGKRGTVNSLRGHAPRVAQVVMDDGTTEEFWVSELRLLKWGDAT
jgi:hypothetical protein